MTRPGTTLRLEHEEGLAILTLTHPARGNPVDGTFAREFRDAVCTLDERPDLRAVLLKAEGENFSFGGDLKAFHAQLDALSPLVLALTADLHAGLQRFWRLPVPIVAAVQGYAMGGALSLVAGCDLVLAGASAKMGSAFAQIGFSCDSGSSVTLTARMGAARAKRFVLLAEVLGSQDALQAGLVDQVVADDALQVTAGALARKLAAGPTAAYGQIKRLFGQASIFAAVEAQMEDEALTLARVAASHDAREGIRAQLERRKPAFTGKA